MDQFWVQGVVKNGQVVLDTPLDLPDGTVVTVMNYDPDDDPRPVGPTTTLTDEEFLELSAFLARKRDPKDWPEFVERIERAQAGRSVPPRGEV